MTERDDEANRWHLEALVGVRTRWREHVEREAKFLGIPWSEVPRTFFKKWWKATGWGRHPPSPEFAAQVPQLLVEDRAKLDRIKRKAVADTGRAREVLRQAETRRPCEQCLRPASPCTERCLRSMLQTLGG
jgi:hypothetical protein